MRPLGLLDVPQAANKGESFGVRVVTYDGNGVATPVSGATVGTRNSRKKSWCATAGGLIRSSPFHSERNGSGVTGDD